MMFQRSYTLPPTPDYPLSIIAKRYWLSHGSNTENPAAQTLIVLHSTSFHKETWEPTLQDLFELVSQSNTEFLIRDAWAVDCPNHGESGILNNQALKDPQFTNFSCESYAHAVHRFLSSGPEAGVRDVDFRRCNLVGLGHSLGANAMLMLQHIQPVVKFSKLIIVEPMISVEGSHHLENLRSRLVLNSSRRQNIWQSLEEAYKSLKRGRTRKWDPRVVQAFMNYAIYRNPQTKLFTLSCTPEQETAMYRDVEGPTKPVEDLNKICHQIPIHLILGKIDDLIPTHVHKALVDPISGRQFASIAWVSGIGHLIPQEVPGILASCINAALSSKAVPVSIPSKL